MNMPIPNLDELDWLDNAVESLLNRQRVPGLAVSRVDSSASIQLRCFGYADAVRQTPIDPRSVFPCASLGKPVSAFMAHLLAAEGALSLDQAIGYYLPEHEDLIHPGLAAITLRQCLSHQSGLPNWREAGENLGQCVAAGTRFVYSGEAYLLSQHVLEAASGQDFETLAQRLVFDPLKMRDSSYSDIGARRHYCVNGYDRQARSVGRIADETPNTAYTLCSTPADYARFLGAQQQSATILTQMSAKEIRIDESLAWGTGWGITDSAAGTCLWHIGDRIHFISLALYFPTVGQGISIMTNGQNGRMVCETLAGLILGEDYPVARWVEAFFKTFDQRTI